MESKGPRFFSWLMWRPVQDKHDDESEDDSASSAKVLEILGHSSSCMDVASV